MVLKAATINADALIPLRLCILLDRPELAYIVPVILKRVGATALEPRMEYRVRTEPLVIFLL